MRVSVDTYFGHDSGLRWFLLLKYMLYERTATTWMDSYPSHFFTKSESIFPGKTRILFSLEKRESYDSEELSLQFSMVILQNISKVSTIFQVGCRNYVQRTFLEDVYRCHCSWKSQYKWPLKHLVVIILKRFVLAIWLVASFGNFQHTSFKWNII